MDSSPPPSAGYLPPGLALSISRVLDKHQPSFSLSTRATTTRNHLDTNGTPAASSHTASADGAVVPLTLNEQMARRFPDLQSLSPTSVDRVQAKLRADMISVDGELDVFLAALRHEHASAKLSESGGIQLAVRQLSEQLDKIRKKAASSESTVREITGDIRTLDTAKRNIVGSMTAIKRLQMLESGAARLETLTSERNFREAAQALDAAKSLQTSFKAYMGVERVSAVWRKINESQQQLRTAAMEEYEAFFLHDSSRPIRSTQIPEAALALNAIGPDAVTALLDWYCALQLREYRRIFRATDEAGHLDNVARRFAWFRRVMKQHEEEHASGFLESWQPALALTGRFADVTREDIKSVLVREKSRLQVSALLEALMATTEFEQQAAKKFNVQVAAILAANPRPVVAAPTGITITTQSPAENISSVFEPYLGIFVEAQDKALAELMAGYRRQGVSTSQSASDQGPPAITTQSSVQDQHYTVLPSSTELFYFYRQTLEQCSRLSNREPFRDLCLVFRRYLRAYSDEVLRSALFKSEASSTFGRRSTSTDTRANVHDLQKWCLILNTADYCANTCSQLEGRLKEKICEELRDDVTLDPEREAFLSLVSATIQVLTRELELCLEPAFSRMLRPLVPWHQLAEVRGKSEYVDDLKSALETVAVIVRQDIENKRYIRSWADKVANLITAKCVNRIVRLRPLHKLAAEQLMIDLYEIRSVLVDLPQFSPSESTSVMGSSYIRHIDKSVSRIEILLRIVIVPESPAETFIDEYVRLVGDRSFSNFQKILELKGIKKSEMNGLIEQFVQITGALQGEQVADTSFLTLLDMDPTQDFLTPPPALDAGLSSSAALARPSYSFRGASSSGVLSPDHGSPRLDGASMGVRVFNTGKFASMLGLGKREDRNSR